MAKVTLNELKNSVNDNKARIEDLEGRLNLTNAILKVVGVGVVAGILGLYIPLLF